ncbi:hypothetical protein VE01_06496 [Pseudogymnoascus verrucosus]|uniref:Protein kinase domain-containing protein n=1 Tax=Pseudogymnoascus verrucosus TaxID=342668 RepID=A0A1B8GIT2_9PEZI|nr:uncharacterized protein VE01_06496 [Pseudogymnoascus verrucosus]OBT95715.1 hypothetical protein VE01_06496 [Pseudogymnoascus verrucosus]
MSSPDIAPRNIILDAEGKAWLIDLGCEDQFKEFCDEVCERISSYPEVEMQRLSIAYGLTTAALA